MSKSIEAQGIIHSIGQTTEYGNNGFTKREFVVKLSGEGENSAYPNFIPFELVKDKCALMDKFEVGQEIIVHFNLTGRLWTPQGKPEKCFVGLQAWRIEPVANEFSQDNGQGPLDDMPPSFSDYEDDIPF